MVVNTCSIGDGKRYSDKSFWNHSCFLISSIEALFIGSTCSIWHNMPTTLLFKYSGMGNTPDLIFLNNVGTCSSSKGSVPHNKAYKITPQDQISTSGPAYSFPDITCCSRKKILPQSSVFVLQNRFNKGSSYLKRYCMINEIPPVQHS